MTIGPLLEESLAIIRRNHLHLPANLALLLKTVAMSESLGVTSAPPAH